MSPRLALFALIGRHRGLDLVYYRALQGGWLSGKLPFQLAFVIHMYDDDWICWVFGTRER